MRIGLWKRGWGRWAYWLAQRNSEPTLSISARADSVAGCVAQSACHLIVCVLDTHASFFNKTIHIFLSSVAFSVSNKFAEFLMIGSFWNLCRTCPSMPVDKVRTPQCVEASTWSILLFFFDMSASDIFYCCGWIVVCYVRKMKSLIRQCAVIIPTVMYGLSNN